MPLVLWLYRCLANRPRPTAKNGTKYRSRPDLQSLNCRFSIRDSVVQNKRKKMVRPSFRRKYSALIVEITHLCDLGYFGFVV